MTIKKVEDSFSESGTVLLSGGRVVDPLQGLDELRDVLIERGIVTAVETPGVLSSRAVDEVIDCSAKLVTPGLIDIHVHLREPGEEWKETIATGTASAVAGGFTAVCCMPNTSPVNDCASVTEHILRKARVANHCRVHPIGAISVGSQGKGLSPMVELYEAGCVAFSDDGSPVRDAGLMRRALEYNSMLGSVLTVHEEEKSLSQGFSMNESALGIKLGLAGMPDAAENIMISRDIELARLTGARVHFCHVSTARGVLLIKRAKEDGILVSAEVTPHHLTLDETAIGDYDTAAKVSMPLRGVEDVAALNEALAAGVIDCIASDHAPHEADSKNVEFDKASMGLIGFPTTLPLTLAKVRSGELSLTRAIECLTASPAKCLNLPPSTLSKGARADVTVIDPERSIVLSKDIIRSKSFNTPFLDWELQGVAVKTIVGGRIAYDIDDDKGVA